MEEKYKKFKEYDWVNSKEWQLYYSNIFPIPPVSKIERYKKKFYRNKIDPDFDINYKPPNEEETNNNSTSGSSSSSSSNSNSSNTNTQYQNAFTNERMYETYKTAQTLADPIKSPQLQALETFLLILFILSLPFRYKTILIGTIAFLIRSIRIAGIPRLNFTYLQVFIMNDACHSLFFIVQTLTDRLNYYMMLPVVVSAIIAICENLTILNLNFGFIKNYVNTINSKKEELLQSKSHIEIAIGFVSIAGIFLKINSIITPIIYWQLMRVRYSINPYIKQSFTDLNALANKIKDNGKCPEPIKFIIEKVQWLFNYMGKMNSPPQGQEQANGNQGGGGMCNIF